MIGSVVVIKLVTVKGCGDFVGSGDMGGGGDCDLRGGRWLVIGCGD